MSICLYFGNTNEVVPLCSETRNAYWLLSDNAELCLKSAGRERERGGGGGEVDVGVRDERDRDGGERQRGVGWR